MEITKAALEARRAMAQKEREQWLTRYAQAEQVVMECDYWLSELAKDTPEPDKAEGTD